MVNGYGNLRQEIIMPDLCTLCGACEAACPISAIDITPDKNVQTFDCSSDFESCHICHEVCPHTAPNLEEAFNNFTKGQYSLPGIGPFMTMKAARSSFEDIRDITRSGGVATTLAICGMEHNLLDSVVSSETRDLKDLPLPMKGKIQPVSDYLPSMFSYSFHPAAVAKAYDSVVKGYSSSRVAFIGVPCHMTALRKLQLFGHKSSDQLGFLIGQFCLWSISSIGSLSLLLEESGVRFEEVEDISVTDKFVVKSKAKMLEFPLNAIWKNVREGCKTCMDFTGYFSDISVGRVEGLSWDWSVVIVRSKQGETILRTAEEEGYVETVKLPHAVPEFVESLASKKKELAKQEVEEDIRRGIGAPGAFRIMEKNIR